ncbi:MAG: cation transporter [Aeropyrum sp.]|nr:cation transporter [Aeropyrum sp.]MCE4615620.1 cation transporter [Aeropyrum sp.]
MSEAGGKNSDARRWYRRPQSPSVSARKILRAVGLLKYIYISAAVSAVMSVVGIAAYLLVYPSSVVLVEAFVWFVEAITFFGLAVAFKIAASRTVYYKARFEILRAESLVVLHSALIGVAIVVGVMLKSVFGKGGEPTPMILALYPGISGVISYILEKYMFAKLKRIEVKLASLRFVAEKLKLDVLLEEAGAVAIILSNMTGQTLFETVLVVVVGLYLVYALGGIAVRNLLYLVGPGPQDERLRVRRQVEMVLSEMGYTPRSIRIESYGTFSEAEVWVEYSGRATLEKSFKTSVSIARALVARIPELLRAVVIMVPVRKTVIRRYYRAEEKGEEPTRAESRGANL